MKTLFIALALVASAYAYSIDDIPEYMRDRLDKYVAIKKRWADKWTSMSEAEQKHYEQVLLERLENLPQIELNRMHDRIETMPEEERTKMLDYLRTRFPLNNDKQYENDVEEIYAIVLALPEMLRLKINSIISVRFQEATAYGIEEVCNNFFYRFIFNLYNYF